MYFNVLQRFEIIITLVKQLMETDSSVNLDCLRSVRSSWAQVKPYRRCNNILEVAVLRLVFPRTSVYAGPDKRERLWAGIR